MFKIDNGSTNPRRRKQFLADHSADNLKIKRIIGFCQLLVTLICVMGLTYQTSQLCLQYTSGQTVVNMKVEKIGYSQLPAITFCYPFFVSMEKLANIYPELKNDFEAYIKTMRNLKSDIKQFSEYNI